MRKIFFAILVFFLYACNNREQRIKYYFFTHLDKMLVFNNIQGSIAQGRETGDWSFLYDDSKISIQGHLEMD